MVYFLALLPATALTIAGYFVLYLSARAEGSLRSFGRYLGFWAFTLAGLVILGAIFAAAHFRHGMRDHGEGCWGHPPMGMDCSRCSMAQPDGGRPEPPPGAAKNGAPAPQ